MGVVAGYRNAARVIAGNNLARHFIFQLGFRAGIAKPKDGVDLGYSRKSSSIQLNVGNVEDSIRLRRIMLQDIGAEGREGTQGGLNSAVVVEEDVHVLDFAGTAVQIAVHLVGRMEGALPADEIEPRGGLRLGGRAPNQVGMMRVILQNVHAGSSQAFQSLVVYRPVKLNQAEALSSLVHALSLAQFRFAISERIKAVARYL